MTLVVACFIAELFYALKTWERLACGSHRVNTFLKKDFIFFPAARKSSSHGRSRGNERGGSSDYSQPDTHRSVRTALMGRGIRLVAPLDHRLESIDRLERVTNEHHRVGGSANRVFEALGVALNQPLAGVQSAAAHQGQQQQRHPRRDLSS